MSFFFGAPHGLDSRPLSHLARDRVRRTEVDAAFERPKTVQEYTDAELVELIERALTERQTTEEWGGPVPALVHEDR